MNSWATNDPLPALPPSAHHGPEEILLTGVYEEMAQRLWEGEGMILYVHWATGILLLVADAGYSPIHWVLADAGCYPAVTQ